MTWQEEFDNEFGYYEDALGIHDANDMKAFIQSLLDQQRKELLDRVRLNAKDYYADTAYKTPEGLVRHNFDMHLFENYNGYNQAISDLEALKKSL